MIHKKLLMLTVLLTVVMLLSFGGAFLIIRNSGVVRSAEQVTKEQEIGGVNKIVFSGVGIMEIVQGDTEKMTMEGDKTFMDNLKVTVANGTLTIDQQRTSINLFSFAPVKGIKYKITVKDLSALEVNGVGDMTMDKLKTENLSIVNNGLASITINDLEASNLSVNFEGAGDIEIMGKVDKQKVVLSGLGSYKARGLISRETIVRMNGSGDVRIFAKELLTGTLEGAGSIEYSGNPKVDVAINGIGDLERIE